MEFVTSLIEKPEPAAVTVSLIQQVHRELMGDIYPFAGRWRTVELHKGEGPVKWPLPRLGLQAAIEGFEQKVLSRTPRLSDDDEATYFFVSELMNEFLAIHPFREGNGRTAFILGNFILMQNDMLPLDVYDERRHQSDYYAACEAGRLHGNYSPLTGLLKEWEEETLAKWGETNAE
jgi:cell filamentation protein